MTARRPRVVFLGHSAQPSGAELGLLRLVGAMTRYEPVVVLAEHGPLVDRLRASGVRCEVLELSDSVANVRHAEIRLGRQLATSARQVLGYSRGLAGLLQDLSPDIVDTFTLKAHVFGRIAVRGMSAPRAAHVHDRLSPEYMRRPSIVLLRAILGRYDGLVFNSESTSATLPALRRNQVRVVVGSAIDRPPAAIGAASRSDVHTFGCVGRLTSWKGQQLAIQAFAELCETQPTRALRLRLIGGAFFGEDDYVAESKALVARLGLSEQVEWRGHVDDIHGELAQLDTLVHCSTIPEPFGQVIVEGMACGVPVIASNEGGPSELVDDGITGLLFAPRDRHSLTEAMYRAVQMESADRRALTTRAQVVARNYYSDRVAERVEGFYDELLATRRRRRP